MKRTISFILTILLTVSMLSVFAFAEDTSGAFDALVDIIGKYSNPQGNLEVEKDANTIYSLRYYSGRVILEIESETISYTTYFSKTTNGTFDWRFYGFSNDENYWDGTYWAEGKLSVVDDKNLDVTGKRGNYDDDIFQDIVNYVKKMSGQAMVFLREIFIMGNADYDFDDFGFSPNYFKTVQCDSHLYGDYFYRFDATLEKDGTRTAVCQHCADTDTVTAYGSMGGTPNSYFLTFTALANAIKNAGTFDANNNPAILKKENNEKYSIIYHKATSWVDAHIEITVARLNDSYSVSIQSSLDGCYKWNYTSNEGTFSGFTRLAEVENTPAYIMSTASNSVTDSVTLLRTKSIRYLKEILSQLAVDREFYEYGFNKDYFEKTSDHVCRPYVADPAVFEALKNAVIENRDVAYNGYKLVAATDDFHMTLMYTEDTDEFVITIRKYIDYEFVMHINEQSFGFNTCNIEAWNQEFEETLATTVTTVYDTYNISPTVKISEQPSSNRVDVVEKMGEGYSQALALLQMFLEIYEVDAHFSDFGFNELYFCPKGHDFSEYVYNDDATETKDGTKTAVCLECHKKDTIMADGTKLVDIVDTSKVFKDVKNKWYKKAVDYCYSYGFIAGLESDRFGLNESVTRGMFITILARIAGVKTSGSANKVATKFSDVKSGKYYTNAIKWASEKGIVNGLSATQFGPENKITREQICVMLVNFADYMGIEITASIYPVSFMDSSKISSWAKDAVRTCQLAEIVSGSEQNGRMYFNPKNNATRAEAAQMLYKFHSTF